MTTVPSTIRNPIFLYIGLIITGLFISCQHESFEIEDVDLMKAENLVIQTLIEEEGILPEGALYEISLPLEWTEDSSPRILIVYAHGYVDPGRPIALPSDELPDGMGGMIQIKDFITSNNFGYASTSYRDNGLVVLDAIDDINQLKVQIMTFFENTDLDPPNSMVLVGPSEGGLITLLTMEQETLKQEPIRFDAAIATCAPIGNFYDQLQYYGDAHVLFKYFFGPSINGINLGSPKRISKHTMNAWIGESLQAAIEQELRDDYTFNNGNKVRQYLACADINIPYELGPDVVIPTILQVLRFAIMATNDAIYRLEGNPYNNKNNFRYYVGSDNDEKLNLTIERIKRTDFFEALENVSDYETTGLIDRPVISFHNQYDHVSLYEHQELYQNKSNPFFIVIPAVENYGHCNFNAVEILEALNSLNPYL